MRTRCAAHNDFLGSNDERALVGAAWSWRAMPRDVRLRGRNGQDARAPLLNGRDAHAPLLS